MLMSLLHNSKFIIYNAKISFTNFGYTLYMITIPAYSFAFSGSILFTGITLFVEYGIYAATSVAGPLVDHVEDKRYVIMISEAGIGLSALTLGLLIYSRRIDDLLFLLIVGVIAICWDFIWTADWVVLPIIVNEDELPRANGYSNAIGNSHVAAGLGVGGLLFAVLGPYFSIILYSACLFIAAGLTFYLPVVIRKREKSLSEGFASGWRYVLRTNRPLLYLSLIMAIFSFFSSAPALGITSLFAVTSRATYAVMYSVYYMGTILVAILLGRFYPRKRVGKTLLLAFICSGLLFAPAIVYADYFAIEIVAWFALGLALSAYIPLYSTYLQVGTKKEMLGRVASNLYTFRGISSAVGTLSIPLLIQSYGLDMTFESAGILMALTALIIFIAVPQVRNIQLRSGVVTEKS